MKHKTNKSYELKKGSPKNLKKKNLKKTTGGFTVGGSSGGNETINMNSDNEDFNNMSDVTINFGNPF
ncbi:MAG: hypothetical protein P4L16_01670 [Chlamydiales bacterium]|nr:hypothetical protein [Chlamydiales bacterium]